MRITPEMVAERDSQANAKYYAPITPFKGVTVARTHLCENCGHKGSLSPNKYWGVGRGCPKCGENRRGSSKVLTSEQVSQRDKCAKAISYSPISEYCGNHTKRIHKCTECGYQGKLTPSAYWSNGTGCPNCAQISKGNARKLSELEIIERDENAKNFKTYPPISAYDGFHLKRIHECKVCHYKGLLSPNNFWRTGTGCPKCSRTAQSERQTLSLDVVAEKDIRAQHYLTFPPINSYKAVKQKRKHRCLDCHVECTMSPDQFWRGGGCPNCSKQQRVSQLVKKHTLTPEIALARDIEAKHFRTYPPVNGEQYVTKNTPRIHECDICGHIGELTPKEFWDDNRGCPSCNKRTLPSKVVIERDKASKHFTTFPPQTPFDGTNIHRLHECSNCGHLGLLIPNLFWRGTGCTNCNFKIGIDEVARRDADAYHSETYPPIQNQEYQGIDSKRKHRCTDVLCGCTGELSPYNFWKKNVGCPKCAEKRIATEQTFNLAQVKQKDQTATYFSDYPPIGEYKNALTPRLHNCSIHGENWTAPSSFWAGTGCPECGKLRGAESRVLTLEEVRSKDQNSLNFQNYPPIGEYTGALIPRLHRCFEHGENWTSPSSFWAGTGCPGCASTGFNNTKPGFLYYLKVECSPTKILYKIGITNRTVQERFTNKDLSKIVVLKLWHFDIGELARRRESEVLREFREFKYNGKSILSSGNSELFTKDILSLDIDS